MITKNVKLYLGDGFPVRIPVSQYDTMWQFVFTIIHNSQPWQIPAGATAVLNGRKPDGNVFAFSGTIANNTVTVDADVQMTAVAGQTVCELSVLSDGKTVGTANFILDVEEAPKSPDDVVSDTVLDGYGMMVTNAVDSWLNSHSGQIGGLTNEAKQALLALLAKVAYVDEHGQTYLDALETALYPPANLVSISAVFNQGSAVIYNTDSLDTLKQYLTVTANMSDGTTQTVTNYTLSGTLTVGTSTVTVSYGDKTTTFDVTVTERTTVIYSLENYTITDGEYIDTNVSPFASGVDTTILLDVNITSNPSSTNSPSYMYKLLSIINDSNIRCLEVGKPGQWNAYMRPVFYNGGDSDSSKIATTSAGRKRIVIIHTANEESMTAIGKNGDDEATTAISTKAYTVTYAPTDAHLYLGRNSTGQGLPPGTINQLKVHNVILSQEEIDAFLA